MQYLAHVIAIGGTARREETHAHKSYGSREAVLDKEHHKHGLRILRTYEQPCIAATDKSCVFIASVVPTSSDEVRKS